MVGTNRRLLPGLGRIGIVCGIAITFILGLASTVYLLSLRNAEVKVPDILGKNYQAGESSLDGAGLNIRKRASRFAPETKPDTILDQSPRAGEMVKVGQTIAVVISRPPKEGESAPAPVEDAAKSDSETAKANANQANNQADDNAASKNQNADKNRRQDKDARNKNADSKSGANANKSNANNRNRNSNNGNANAGNRNAGNLNANNRNASNRPTNANTNRGINNLNANKRPPALQTPPFNSNGNTRRP